MVALTFRNAVAIDPDWGVAGIKDLLIRDTDDGGGLYLQSGSGGGVAGWQLQPDQAAQALGVQVFAPSDAPWTAGTLFELPGGIAFAGNGDSGFV